MKKKKINKVVETTPSLKLFVLGMSNMKKYNRFLIDKSSEYIIILTKGKMKEKINKRKELKKKVDIVYILKLTFVD